MRLNTFFNLSKVAVFVYFIPHIDFNMNRMVFINSIILEIFSIETFCPVDGGSRDIIMDLVSSDILLMGNS